jgi:uncharacterized protein YcfJ
MSDFEKGFNEELAKIAEDYGYTPEEIERLRHITERDIQTGREGALAHLTGAAVGTPVGAGLGALVGRRFGSPGKGAFIGGAAGLVGGPLVGTTANILKHGPELGQLRQEAKGIHEGKDPEQIKGIAQQLWQEAHAK